MKISRLPISIFRDLESTEAAQTLDSNDSKLQIVTDAPMSPAEELKSCICSKLAAAASHTTWAHRHFHDNNGNNYIFYLFLPRIYLSFIKISFCKYLELFRWDLQLHLLIITNIKTRSGLLTLTNLSIAILIR
jgi:hypothetical protein